MEFYVPLSLPAIQTEFELLWRHDFKWGEHPAIKDGKVFFPMAANPPNLKVLDLYTGKIICTIPLNHFSCCSPWFAHGNVYIYAFKPLTGIKPKSCIYVIDMNTWTIKHEWPINCTIDVEVCPYDQETDCFYLPTGCYNAETGKQVWSMSPSGRGGVLIVGDTVYYHAKKIFRAHDKETGELLWDIPLLENEGNSYNTPIFDQDHGFIYIGSDISRSRGNVYAIDVIKRKIAWVRSFNPGAITSVLTYHRGRIFVPLFNGPAGKRRVALYWKNGQTLWEKSVSQDDGWATSAVDDRYLYTASHGGGMFIVQDQSTGQIVWSLPAKPGICCSPIISGGVVVIGTKRDCFAVRIGHGDLIDANWRGNAFYTGFSPGAVEIPEEEMVAEADLTIIHDTEDLIPLNMGDIRLATFNAFLSRNAEGQLVEDLSTLHNTQAQNIAEIIQRINPDILLINEFDYVEDYLAVDLFQQNYLSGSQNGADPIDFPYSFCTCSNTGIDSGFDLDNDGIATGTGNDAFGFGLFPGQYGMVLFSKYPIIENQIRTFQTFLWIDMPDAMLPIDPVTGESWYSAEELDIFRLSSKSHWDVPINVNGIVIHVLVSHPTPSVLDGTEDRNGRRNHDEIRFWSDYVTPGAGDYIYDDNGVHGGLQANERFVIMGDLNADPFDGDSTNDAILQLLNNIRIDASFTPRSDGGTESSLIKGSLNDFHLGDPAYDTVEWDTPPGNLRTDYVLPSVEGLDIDNGGVFWPLQTDFLSRLVKMSPMASSDHRLVYLDLYIDEADLEDTDEDGDGWTINDGDCDDNDSTVYPGASGTHDGKDNDCNGIIESDEKRSAPFKMYPYYQSLQLLGYQSSIYQQYGILAYQQRIPQLWSSLLPSIYQQPWPNINQYVFFQKPFMKATFIGSQFHTLFNQHSFYQSYLQYFNFR